MQDRPTGSTAGLHPCRGLHLCAWAWMCLYICRWGDGIVPWTCVSWHGCIEWTGSTTLPPSFLYFPSWETLQSAMAMMRGHACRCRRPACTLRRGCDHAKPRGPGSEGRIRHTDGASACALQDETRLCACPPAGRDMWPSARRAWPPIGNVSQQRGPVPYRLYIRAMTWPNVWTGGEEREDQDPADVVAVVVSLDPCPFAVL